MSETDCCAVLSQEQELQKKRSEAQGKCLCILVQGPRAARNPKRNACNLKEPELPSVRTNPFNPLPFGPKQLLSHHTGSLRVGFGLGSVEGTAV